MLPLWKNEQPLSVISSDPIFARHDTFHPRFGWIKKGFDAVLNNPGVFLQEDTHIQLGVGKNMGQAIRYWCSTFKVVDTVLSENTRKMLPTEFGKKLLMDDGYDPFLEDTASLWLLHWNLLKPPCLATAWEFTFNSFRKPEFTTEDLFIALSDYRDSVAPRISESSIRKDLTCILRMYTEQNSKTELNEETLDCPFSELGIMRMIGSNKQYMFNMGVKSNLPAEIIVYACLDYASRICHGQKTISISRLLYDPGSPGSIFKIPESVIYDAIEKVTGQTRSIALSDTAGLVQFSFIDDPAVISENILDKYYMQKRGKV